MSLASGAASQAQGWPGPPGPASGPAPQVLEGVLALEREEEGLVCRKQLGLEQSIKCSSRHRFGTLGMFVD